MKKIRYDRSLKSTNASTPISDLAVDGVFACGGVSGRKKLKSPSPIETTAAM